MMQNESYIWNWLKTKTELNDYAVAGIMANMQGESAGLANNLEDRVNDRLGITDAEYTARVDSGMYDIEFFARENGLYGGYGLCQWTEQSRSRKMYNYIRGKKGKSIGDMDAQLEWMVYEMQTDFKSVWQALLTANNLLSAVTVVCERYEVPANPSAQTALRYTYAEGIYNRNHKEVETATEPAKPDNTELVNELLDIISKLKELVGKL